MAKRPRFTGHKKPRRTSGFVEFTYRDVELSMPLGEDLPLEAAEALEREEIVGFVAAALGPEQWTAVRATGPMSLRDFNELMEAFKEAEGASLGE